MKTLKAGRLIHVTTIFLIACIGVSCDKENEVDVNGTWLVQEPPELMSRQNRSDGSIPVFDVIFTIQGKAISEIDLLIDGVAVDGEAGTVKLNDETADITIEYQNFNLHLNKCKRVNSNAMLIGSMEYTLPDNTTHTYKGITVGTYN